MPVAVSSVAEKRFQKYQVSWPEGWDVRYIQPPYTEEVLNVCKDADYLFVDSMDPITEEIITRCPHLKMIHTEGVSYDKIDIQAAAKAGVYVCNNRAVNKTAVAEHCVCLMLAGIKKVAWLDRSVREKGYAAANQAFLASGIHEIGGMTVGMIGMGAIGKEVVARLTGWNCRLCYYDVFRMTPEQETSLGVEFLELDELLKQSDIISIHVPVLPSTIHMIDRRALGLMKPNAIVVNVSRGEIICDEDLVRALENDVIGGAALDTIAPEPMPDDHPLRRMSEKAEAKLTITTHVAGKTDEAFQRMLVWAVENFQRVERKEPPINVVNGR